MFLHAVGMGREECHEVRFASGCTHCVNLWPDWFQTVFAHLSHILKIQVALVVAQTRALMFTGHQEWSGMSSIIRYYLFITEDCRVLLPFCVLPFHPVDILLEFLQTSLQSIFDSTTDYCQLFQIFLIYSSANPGLICWSKLRSSSPERYLAPVTAHLAQLQ